MADNKQVPEWRQNLRKPAFWAMFALFLGYVANYADRTLLSVLQEDIKADLNLSDFELGLLAGPVFALFYGVLSLPLARLAERYNRKRIILIGLTLWSGFTALCGLAQNMVQLAIFRMSVGASEAAAPPAMHSLIADYFSRKARGRAMALLAMGIPVGLMLGGLLGGQIAHWFNWRVAFVAIGLPGILLALASTKLLYEAERTSDHGELETERLGFMDCVKSLLANPVYRVLLIAAILTGNAAHAVSAFVASFFIRVHDFDLATVGGVIYMGKGLAGIAGTLIGGYMSDKLDRGRGQDYLLVPALGCVLAGCFYGSSIYISSALIGMGCFFIGAFGANMVISPAFAAVQNVVDPRTRATAAAMFMFCVTTPGSLGPVIVGLISDMTASSSLGLSLTEYADVCPGGKLAADFAGSLPGTCEGAARRGLQLGMSIALGLYAVAMLAYFWAVHNGRFYQKKAEAAKASSEAAGAQAE